MKATGIGSFGNAFQSIPGKAAAGRRVTIRGWIKTRDVSKGYAGLWCRIDGPEGMLAATAKTAAKYSRPCQVSVERIMGCGMGGCYSCVVPMRGDDGKFHHVRSCMAGPVLAADQIQWD